MSQSPNDGNGTDRPDVPEVGGGAERPGLITKRDVFSSWWRWLFFSHANYNWERYQGTGFAHAMSPIIEKLYPDHDDRVQALERHTVFFNTEPDTGGVIHGITIAMEEQRAAGAPIDDQAINRVKVGLMGPFAGLGDAIKQGMWFPVWQSIGIGIAVGAAGAVSGIAGPLLYLLAILAYIAFGWWLYYQGYARGQDLVTDMLGSGLLEKVRMGAGVLGAAVLGALGAAFVTVQTGIRWSVTTGTGEDAVVQDFSIQENLFDALMPGLLSLITLVTIILLMRRGVKIVAIIVYIFGITLAAALIEAASRYAISEDSAFGVFQTSSGVPTLIGLGVLFAITYYLAVRKQNLKAGHTFVLTTAGLTIVGSWLAVLTGYPFQIFWHF